MYVKTTRTPDRPPPRTEIGVIGWLRQNLFSSWLNAAMTAAGLALLWWALPPFLEWAVFKANWIGDSRAACSLPEGNPDGACWIFVKVRLGMLMYGFYPESERWRIDFAFLVLAASAGPLLAVPLVPPSWNRSCWPQRVFFVAVICLILGGYGIAPAAVALAYLAAPKVLAGLHRGSLNHGHSTIHLAAIMIPAALTCGGIIFLARRLGYQMEELLGLTGAALLIIFIAVKSSSESTWRFLLLLTVYPCIACACFLGGVFGLKPVETDLWGGMFLTLVLGGVGISASLPIGILLALGRRSSMPVIKASCIGFIEFIRGVPLISVLFMVSVMLPLTLPEGMSINKLLRALVGVSLFYAAYMAEVVRGGLQAIPRGQYEAAEAMGLPYRKAMGLIILPQALRLVIPGLTNTSLGLAKDTTLVAVINLMDLLGILKSALADSNWLGFTKEAYVFAGLAFWVICFGISRYSMRLETVLQREKHHTGVDHG